MNTAQEREYGERRKWIYEKSQVKKMEKKEWLFGALGFKFLA